MIDPDALNVWFQEQLVGYLWRSSVGTIGFAYDSEWLNGSNFAISCKLALRSEDYTAEEGLAQRFFANLLPEGGVRDRIVRDLKIPNTDFDLLRAIGGECAGAISILPVERLPTSKTSYRPLAKDELLKLVARRGQIYASLPIEKRPRLS